MTWGSVNGFGYEVFRCPEDYRLVTEEPVPQELAKGWYFWPCSPGCLPDAEAMGPYATEEAAWEEIREIEMEAM